MERTVSDELANDIQNDAKTANSAASKATSIEANNPTLKQEEENRNKEKTEPQSRNKED